MATPAATSPTNNSSSSAGSARGSVPPYRYGSEETPFFVAAAFKDGVSELASLEYSQFVPSMMPCAGGAVVITSSSAASPNGACPALWPGFSCSCISNSRVQAASEWEFHLLPAERKPTTVVPAATVDAGTAMLHVSTIGQFALPRNVTSLRLVGATTGAPLKFEFDLAAPYSKDDTVSLVLLESENFLQTVEIANIDFSNVDINENFLPPSVKELTVRNCGISTLPSPYLFARWNRLLTIDVSDNALTTWYGDELWSTPSEACTITTLNVAGNQLTSIPESVAYMGALQTLNISRNPISNFTISEELFNRITSLESFVTDGIDTSSVTQKSCPDGATRAFGNLTLCVVPSATVSSSSSALVFVAIGGSVVIVVLLVALLFVHKKRRDDQRGKAMSRTVHDESGLRSGFESIPAARSNHSLSFTSNDHHQTAMLDSGLLNDPLIITSRLDDKEIRFGELIKQGGFGNVYSGVYKRRRVAIKMLRPEHTTDTQLVESFMKEIALMASLRHARIVEYIGCAWDSIKTLSMVTELMPRGDLREVLQQFKRRKARLTWADHKARIALHVAEALEYLHTSSPKVIHRDLKSKNILVTNEIDAKLTDFGISREGRFEQTHMTAGIGTSFWIAPEVLAGLRYDERADIFSFGVVLSEIDTDDYPYWNDRSELPAGQSEKQPRGHVEEGLILRKVLAGEMRPQFSRECPPVIRVLAEKCLEGEPGKRPCASEIVMYLKQLVDATPELRARILGLLV